MGASRVAILMGSDSDWPIMKKAAIMLNELGVANEAHVMSAHRTPDDVADFVREAPGRGIDVFIAGAGMAAHLAGVVAAFTRSTSASSSCAKWLSTSMPSSRQRSSTCVCSSPNSRDNSYTRTLLMGSHYAVWRHLLRDGLPVAREPAVHSTGDPQCKLS